MAHEGADGATQSSIPSHLDVEARASPYSLPRRQVSSPLSRESVDLEKRRPKRSQTPKTYLPKIRGRQWQPGLEPGIDPASATPSSSGVDLVAQCEITVVDYSEQLINVEYMDNASLGAFLESVGPNERGCRWISVNGLSWDVVSLLGIKYGLHRLAIEDVLNRKNRTKADWYADHLYVVMPLQKLVSTDRDEHEPKDYWGAKGASPEVGPKKKIPLLQRWRGQRKPQKPGLARKVTTDHPLQGKGPRPSDVPPRTLQQYYGGPNEDHTEFSQ